MRRFAANERPGVGPPQAERLCVAIDLVAGAELGCCLCERCLIVGIGKPILGHDLGPLRRFLEFCQFFADRVAKALRVVGESKAAPATDFLRSEEHTSELPSLMRI